MHIDEENTDVVLRQQKPRPSPAASSDLSSISSHALIEKEPTPVTEPKPSSAKRRDYSRDFMSYYVTGGDEDDDEGEDDVAPPLTEPAPRNPPTVKQAPAVQEPAPPRETKFKHHQVPPTYPAMRLQPPPPVPAPPIIQIIDTSKKPIRPMEPDTVANMIKKLEVLSTALTRFGGVPTVPKSPEESNQVCKFASNSCLGFVQTTDISAAPSPALKPETQPKRTTEKSGAAVDDFLAMFDDDDDSDGNGHEGDKDDSGGEGLNYKLKNPGELDDPLTFGIAFIQNALKSWAGQRLTSQYQQYHQQALADAQPQRRGPGRPRKFDNGEEDQSVPSLPATVQVDIAKTHEYTAIAAFEDVLGSGCLRVNAVLPSELSRALRHLYMQIDYLINQGSRSEPPWQCMSYGAQITAQKIRVDKWKEAQAKAHEEMARQQHLAQQQVMQQMGIPQQARGVMNAQQAQQAHAIELERRRSRQHAAQQPHLTQYLTNPLSLDPQPTPTPTPTATRPAPPPSPVHRTSASSPGAATTSAPAKVRDGGPSQSSLAEGKGFQLDKMKLYMPNYLPRSGQSMKFSFAPHNELALKAFGPQAFPISNNGTSNIPNRGPQNIPRMPNGSAPSPVLGSNGQTSAPPTPNRSNSDTIDVAMKNTDRRTSQTAGTDGKAVTSVTNGTASVKDNADNAGGFSAVNMSGARQRSDSVPDGSPSKISAPNGMHASSAASMLASPSSSASGSKDKGANLASRFPHPGAVVLDQ